MREYILQLDEVFALFGDKIDELGIFFAETSVDPETTSNPEAAVIMKGSKLGIFHWALKPMFIYSMKIFLKLHESLQRGEAALGEIHSELASLSRAVLIIKDSPLVLIIRKKLIDSGYITTCEEMKFVGLILSRHPKSSYLWEHRRWCIQRGYSACFQISVEAFNERALNIELNLCSNLSDTFPKNYFSWTHRLWLLQFMDRDRIYVENIFCKNWLLNHVSDHSASNHKTQVVIRLIHIENASKFTVLNVLESMLMESAELIVQRPGSESLWYHRRSLVEMLFEVLSKWNIIEITDISFEQSIMHLSGFLSRVHHRNLRDAHFECDIKNSFDALRTHVKSKTRSNSTVNNFLFHWLSAEITFSLSSYRGIWNQENQQKFVQKYLKFSMCRYINFVHSDKSSKHEISTIYRKLQRRAVVRNIKCDFVRANRKASIFGTISSLINNHLNIFFTKILLRFYDCKHS